jgi:HD-like signal output (HDOD) protein
MQSGGPRLDIIDRERTAVRFDHCWIGERVADKWDLSASLRLAISKHHRILSDSHPEIIQRLAITRLAERLAYTAKVGVVDDHPFDTSIDGGLLKAAGVEQDHLKIILGEIPQVVAAAKQEV